jgi:hypothetical protein
MQAQILPCIPAIFQLSFQKQIHATDYVTRRKENEKFSSRHHRSNRFLALWNLDRAVVGASAQTVAQTARASRDATRMAEASPRARFADFDAAQRRAHVARHLP